MKIILLTSSLGAGGAERVASTLCNAWSNRGNEVSLIPTFSGGGNPFYMINEGVELVYLADIVNIKGKSLLGSFYRLITLRSMLKERNPDVVISFLPNVNVALIVSSIGLDFPIIVSERRDPSSQPCSKFWELACWLTYRFADALVVQTTSVKLSIKYIYPKLNRVCVIPNPLPEEVRLEGGRKKTIERKVLLSLGRLSEEKQVDHIIKSFSLLAHIFLDWDLHVYGDGRELVSLKNLVEQLDMQGRVFFMGCTDNPWSVMVNSDIFVMTSKFEGFPNALLEAMGLGLPCIAYDCPSGPNDITRAGKDALLVPLNDRSALTESLNKLMSNEQLQKSLGLQAKELTMQRFQLSAILEQWKRLFKEVDIKF
jgi:GalNAc-alpha-(1->4)-GalNAc-alpha-(1->3)-diNAcBac-PP-undecaprenol alpha-1,4-N-acetyl-D-galactosaminyltransferase